MSNTGAAAGRKTTYHGFMQVPVPVERLLAGYGIQECPAGFKSTREDGQLYCDKLNVIKYKCPPNWTPISKNDGKLYCRPPKDGEFNAPRNFEHCRGGDSHFGGYSLYQKRYWADEDCEVVWPNPEDDN